MEGHRTWRQFLRQMAVALGCGPFTARLEAAPPSTLIKNVSDQLQPNQVGIKQGPVDLSEPAVSTLGHWPQQLLETRR